MDDFDVPAGLNHAIELNDRELVFATLWLFCTEHFRGLKRALGSVQLRSVKACGLPVSERTSATAVELLGWLIQADTDLLDCVLLFAEIEVNGTRSVVLPFQGIVARIINEEHPTWDGSGESSLFSIVRHHRLLRCEIDGIALSVRELQDPLIEDGLAVRVADSNEPAATITTLENATNQPGFVVACWPVRAWAFTAPEGKSHPIRIQETTSDGVESLIDELTFAVGEADLAKATVLIFPELVAPPEAVTALQNHLAATERTHLALVVIGTAHDDHPLVTSCHRNRALALGGSGGVLWYHDKIDPFTDGDRSESLVCGNKIEIVHSPLGLMAMAICKDMLGPIQSVFEHLPIELQWLPSMSETTNAHRNATQTVMARQGTASFVANRPFIWHPGTPVEDTWAPFARLPGKAKNALPGRDRGHVVQSAEEQFLKVRVP